MAFAGFPASAFDFYDDLAANNSKTWWAAHKETYDDCVKAPMVALCDALADEFGTGHVFRPYRDVRFAKDKTPYKDHQGAFVGVEDAVGYYVQVSGAGLMVAGGWYAPQGKQVERYRDAVDGLAGAELDKLLAAVRRSGLELEGDVMKTRPRGVDPDHPRLELLRYRSLVGSRQHGQPAWVHDRTALTRVRKDWRALRPLVEWLADHVGPADDGPPPEPR